MKATLAFSAIAAASAATDQPFDITWNGGALQTWGTCAQWSSSHCPLPCSSVTLDALVAVTQPETVGYVLVRKVTAALRSVRPLESKSAVRATWRRAAPA